MLLIERNDSIQIEKQGKIIVKAKINWIDECSYLLIFLEGNDAWWKSRGENRSVPDVIVKITGIYGNSYFQESKFVNDNKIPPVIKVDKIE